MFSDIQVSCSICLKTAKRCAPLQWRGNRKKKEKGRGGKERKGCREKGRGERGEGKPKWAVKKGPNPTAVQQIGMGQKVPERDSPVGKWHWESPWLGCSFIKSCSERWGGSLCSLGRSSDRGMNLSKQKGSYSRGENSKLFWKWNIIIEYYLAKFHIFIRSLYGKQSIDVTNYCDTIILKKQRRGQGGEKVWAY